MPKRIRFTGKESQTLGSGPQGYDPDTIKSKAGHPRFPLSNPSWVQPILRKDTKTTPGAGAYEIVK